MTEKEKEKAYDEAIERAKKSYGNGIAEEIFPELYESEDEMIKTAILNLLKIWRNYKDYVCGVHVEDAIARLEKQRDKDKLIQELGEYKVKYTQEVLEKYINSMSNKDDERLRKTAIAFLKDFAEQGYENAVECIDWLEKQGEQKPCMVQWKGDNLKEVIGFTGKDKNFEKWFKSFEEYEKYVHEHNDIFKLFNENGSHYEIPVGAWIVKTPDGYNIASNAILKQKSADKIEPTFNVDDWVVNKFGDSWHIDSLDKKNYQVSDGKGNYNYFPISKQDEMHLWTIQDAKDGDFLCCKSGWMCIFKSLNNYINTFSSYCFMDSNKCFFNSGGECHTLDKEFINAYNGEIHPATKEQYDILFQKIKEAGYKWNDETKTLEKLIKPKFKIGDKIRHKDTNKDDVYEIGNVYDGSYGIVDFNWMIYMKYQDQYELVPNKFDPKTLKPFDKVLVKNDDDITWVAALFSHIIEFHDEVTGNDYLESVTSYCTSSFCIPYNDDTKHLVGTEDEAPEFYKYWED